MVSTDLQNTSQGRKKPTGKKAKKLSQKEQSERFIETALEVDVDENGEVFERVISKILPQRGSDIPQ